MKSSSALAIWVLMLPSVYNDKYLASFYLRFFLVTIKNIGISLFSILFSIRRAINNFRSSRLLYFILTIQFCIYMNMAAQLHNRLTYLNIISNSAQFNNNIHSDFKASYSHIDNVYQQFYRQHQNLLMLVVGVDY